MNGKDHIEFIHPTYEPILSDDHAQLEAHKSFISLAVHLIKKTSRIKYLCLSKL